MALHEKFNHEVRRVDPSGRLSLGRDRAGEHFDITEHPDGTLVLTPVSIIPKREAWLYKNPEAMALLQKGLSESGRGEAAFVESFAQYAEDEVEED